MTDTFTGMPEVNQVYHADLFDLCAALDDNSVDMILADLPYESLEVGWDKLIPVENMWWQFERVITPTGAIVLTAKQPFSALLITSNLRKYRYSWYWEKAKGANVSQTAHRPLAVIEEVLVFSHAPAVFSTVPTINYYPQRQKLDRPYTQKFNPTDKVVTNHSVGSPMRNPERIVGTRTYEFATPRNLLYATTMSEGARIHPTQKPIALFRYLIRTYTQPGELVLDPCVGSGTTALAAREEGRRFICGDTSAEYVAIAKERLAAPYTLPLFAP